jgi:hypothetical protein
MRDLDGDTGESAEAVMGSLDREGRQCLLAPAT